MWKSRRSPMRSITQIVCPSAVRSSTVPLWYSKPRRLRETTSPASREFQSDILRLCALHAAGVLSRLLFQMSFTGNVLLGDGAGIGGRASDECFLLQAYRRLLTIARMESVLSKDGRHVQKGTAPEGESMIKATVMSDATTQD